MAQKLSLSQIESGAQLKELLAWFQKLRKWALRRSWILSGQKPGRLRKSPATAGDVDRLIAEVRKSNGKTKPPRLSWTPNVIISSLWGGKSPAISSIHGRMAESSARFLSHPEGISGLRAF